MIVVLELPCKFITDTYSLQVLQLVLAYPISRVANRSSVIGTPISNLYLSLTKRKTHTWLKLCIENWFQRCSFRQLQCASGNTDVWRLRRRERYQTRRAGDREERLDTDGMIWTELREPQSLNQLCSDATTCSFRPTNSQRISSTSSIFENSFYQPSFLSLNSSSSCFSACMLFGLCHSDIADTSGDMHGIPRGSSYQLSTEGLCKEIWCFSSWSKHSTCSETWASRFSRVAGINYTIPRHSSKSRFQSLHSQLAAPFE